MRSNLISDLACLRCADSPILAMILESNLSNFIGASKIQRWLLVNCTIYHIRVCIVIL